MPEETRRVIVQIDHPGEKLTLAEAVSLFEGSGFELDRGYGPICVNPSAGRFVVRGQASPEAAERLRRIEGVRVFTDAPLKPATGPAVGPTTRRR
jgi:hypothetical protein